MNLIRILLGWKYPFKRKKLSVIATASSSLGQFLFLILLLALFIPLLTPIAAAQNSQVIDGVDGVNGLAGANAVALSNDGNHLYATGFSDNAIAAFSRDPNTGALTFISAITNSDLGGNGLQGPSAVAISPDDKHVYLASSTDSAIVAFTRAPSTGQLTLTEIQQNGGNGIDGLSGATAIAISSDGLHLYVTGNRDNAIAVFQREVNTGTLTFLQKQQDGLNNVDGLQGATDITLSQDNRFLYVTGNKDNAVAVFSTSPQLTFVAAYKNGDQPDDKPAISGLTGASGLSLSPDNNHLYVAGNIDNTVVAFSRDTGTGELTHLETHKQGLNGISSLSGAKEIAINPDGNTLYVASFSSNAIAIFTRDPSTGRLEFKQAIQNNTGNLTTLKGAMAITTSPDGAFIYAAAFLSNAINIFGTLSTDLEVTMDAPTQVAINKTLSYTLTVTNNGPDTATGVVLTNTLPSGVRFESASSSCHYTTGDNTVTCTLDQLKPNAESAINITITTPGTVGSGTLTNTATVTANETDGNATNNSISKKTSLLEFVPEADLTVNISTNTQTVTISTPLIYTVTVTNDGPDTANNVRLTATLPAEVTYNADDTDKRCAENAGTVTCQLGAVKVGQTESTEALIHVTTPATTGELSFSAQITGNEFDPNTDNNQAQQQNTVAILEVDLIIIDALATPATSGVEAGTEITYTIKAANQGQETATRVTLTATIPAQLTYLSNTDEDNCIFAQAKLTCNLDSLEPQTDPNSDDQTKQIGLTVKATQTGSHLNTATTFTLSGDGTDTDESNNTQSFPLNHILGVAADFVVTIDDDGQSALIDKPFTYTVVVTNNGPDEASGNLNVILTGNNLIIGTITGDNCGTGTQFECSLQAIPAGGNKTVTIEATPTEPGNLTITAEVTSDVFDPTLPNTTSLQTAVSNKQSNLNITLKAEPSPAFKEKNLIYTMVVTNNGPHQATGVTVTQQLPASVTYISAGSEQGEACTQANNLVTCTIGPVDQTATLVTVVKPQTIGKLTTTASVNSDTFDSNPSDNTVQLETEVSQFSADISLEISDTPDPVLVDSPLVYTLTLTNNGPEAATQIEVTNDLPNTVTYQSPATISPADISSNCIEVNASTRSRAVRQDGSSTDPTASTDTGSTDATSPPIDGDILCTIESLPKDGSATITIEVLPTVAGEITFTASLQGNEYDPAPDNNQAQADSRVNNPATLFFIEAQQNGLKGVEGIRGASALTLSPDGEHLYVTGFNDNALAVFKRNNHDGQLKFTQVLFNGTNNVEGLAGASGIHISPDGNYVYTTGFSDNAVAAFKRDALSGTLTFVETHQQSINGVDGIAGASAVLVTDDHLYVAGSVGDAIGLFGRDSNTGKLTFKQAIRFEDDNQRLDGVTALALSPNGLQLLATSANNNRLSVFSRDTDTGTLTLQQTLTNNTDGVQGLDKVSGVVISADGQSVYTVSRGIDNSLAVFNRSPDAGTLTFVESHRDGVDEVEGLNGVSGLAISSDDNYIYTASRNDNAVAAFLRHSDTGKLRFIEVLTNGVDEVDGLAGASAITVSPNGAHVYAASSAADAVAVLSIATTDLSLTLSDSDDPIGVGDNLVYNLTVTNNGPHQATGVSLLDTLPTNIKLISLSPSQGTCLPTPTQEQINCSLGTLNNGARVTLNIVVSPIDIGELTNKATVSANQYDPSSPNTVTETTQVVAEADLWLSMIVTPEPARIETALTYEIAITNNGPDEAQNISVTNEIPANVKYVSAQVSTETTRCLYDEGKRSVTCSIERIAAGANSLMTLVVMPNTAGETLINTATVTASAFDSNLPNNTVTQTTEVLFNSIKETYDNSGKTLHNYLIDPSGAVIGGSVSGTINNQGLLSEVQVLPNTTVTGGKLSKTIDNQGIIENVELLSGTQINGGILRGQISGFPGAPAQINAQIAVGAELSHVVLGINSQLNANILLGEGVTFADNRLIPSGLDLTGTLAKISGPIKGSLAIDLSKDVLQGGESLLDAINAIPYLKNNDLAFSQLPDTGLLMLPLGNENLVLMPVNVRQTSSAATPTMTIHDDGRVTFITETKRQILAQPTSQSPADLQTQLASLGLTQLEVATDGNLTLTAIDLFKVRPERYTPEVDPKLPLGLDVIPSGLINEFSFFVHRFVDDAGLHRQQLFYPTPAHSEELRSFLQGIPGATAVDIYNNGKISVKIGGRTYSALTDYLIKSGSGTAATQMLSVADQNGDGSEELWITYANGDRQLFYLMPFPEVVADIQAISEVKAAGYRVSQDMAGNYILEKDNEQVVVKVTAITAVDESPGMTTRPDGSIVFITDTGIKITTQPLFQDIPALVDELQKLGLGAVGVDEDGYLIIPFDDSTSFSGRPNTKATLAWVGMPLGLHFFPTTLPSVLSVKLVFRDEQGLKRQQDIYPAAKYPQQLQNFLITSPGVESVRLDNDGTVTVIGGSNAFVGIIDYAVEISGAPTGGLRLTEIADANGDEVEDLAVIYQGGERQIIYRIPPPE